MVGYWIFMLIVDLLIPLIMIGFGRMSVSKPPKHINDLFGYRTSMSMKNRDTWEFAHKYCGQLWFRGGVVLLPVSILPLLLVFGKDINTIGIVGGIVCCAQSVPLILSIIFTENALKKTFDQNGNRKKGQETY